MGQSAWRPSSVRKTEHDIDHMTSSRAPGCRSPSSTSGRTAPGQEACMARERWRVNLDRRSSVLLRDRAASGTYGSPQVLRDLREAGWRVSENTVAARMAQLGLAGRARKELRSLTRQGQRAAAPVCSGERSPPP
ncbi:transposase [Nonomuraea wenchangensis]